MGTVNARKKKLDSICRKIALFVVQETFTDEKGAQKLLDDAISLIDKATAILVANDEKAK